MSECRYVWIFIFSIQSLYTTTECSNVGEWGEWTSCPNTCDEGTSVRIRPCLINDCDEEVFQTRPCATQACQRESVIEGNWGSWGPCLGGCGNTATRKRVWKCFDGMKNCIKEGSFEIENCWRECSECSDTISKRACEFMGRSLRMCKSSRSYNAMLKNCPKTCEFCDAKCKCETGWGIWAECSLTCGGGYRVRSRHCGEFAEECGLSVNDAEICNSKKCVEWSQCSKTCDIGTQMTLCEETDANCKKEYKECSVNNCPEDACDRRTDIYRYQSNSDCCDPVNASISCGRFELSSQIVGGEEAVGNSWPWMLQLKLGYPKGKRFSYCGAILVTDTWVLTAAHCVFVYNENHTLVIGGIKNMKESGQRIYAKRVITHPKFSMPNDDIALIELRRPFILKTKETPNRKISPLCLPLQEETPIDAACYVAGWGATDITRIVVNKILNQARIKNLDLNICINAYKADYYGRKISDSMLCAGRLSGGVDTCQGDSGGPMMCQRCSSCSWYLAGITSFGSIKCGSAGKPGVYTKIVDYEGWIMSYIQDPTENGTFAGTC